MIDGNLRIKMINAINEKDLVTVWSRADLTEGVPLSFTDNWIEFANEKFVAIPFIVSIEFHD